MISNPETSDDQAAALDQARKLLATNPALVAEQAQELLRRAPNQPAASLLLGLAMRTLGALPDAIAILERLARRHPRWAPAHYELGVSLVAAGRANEALASLQLAARLRPDIGEVWRLIADLLIELGDPAAADRAYANHRAVSTGNPALQAPAAALCEGRLAEAERILLAYLRDHPTNAPAMHMLAEVAARDGRHEDAEIVLAKCLELSPDFTAARHSRATVLYRLGRNIDCLAEIERLLAADSRNPAYRDLKANALTGIGEYGRAIEEFAAVLADYPGNAKIWLAYGHALKTAGRRDECIEAYRRAIALAPSLGEAYWSLANLKTFRFSADDVAAMRSRLERADLADEDRLHFEFALGKALEDAQAYAESFSHYAAGNVIRRAALQYDASGITRYVERNQAFFTAEFFRGRHDWGSQDDSPIFVIGMPRAGSTLIEQILSSHSTVEGTMELTDVDRIARSVFEETRKATSMLYPELLAGLGAEEFRTLGERYLTQTRIHRKSGMPHFIDKMPNNWMHVGFIHLMLPNAKIVDARRHPLSCCFSNFKQHFARGQHFTYSLGDMGHYYRDYVALMAHFDEVLPGRVHRVIYERMVEDTEAEIRRLLEYCGLPFEERCVRFYETERAVRTPSAEQVRQPIFRDGVEQWRNYEPWLGPLKAAIGSALTDYVG